MAINVRISYPKRLNKKLKKQKTDRYDWRLGRRMFCRIWRIYWQKRIFEILIFGSRNECISTFFRHLIKPENQRTGEVLLKQIFSDAFPKRKHSSDCRSIFIVSTMTLQNLARLTPKKRRTGRAMHFWPCHSLRSTLGYVEGVLAWFCACIDLGTVLWRWVPIRKIACSVEVQRNLPLQSSFTFVEFHASIYTCNYRTVLLQYHLRDLPILPALHSMHP